MNRRDFLKNSFKACSFLGANSLLSNFLASNSVYANEFSANNKVLIFIYLPGGFDGLNVTEPDDAAFRELRPTLATDSNNLINLDSYWKLNNICEPQKEIYDNGDLAIFPACGNPNGTRSHFTAQDFMRSGFSSISKDGWMNNSLHYNQSANPFRAVSLTGKLNRILKGPEFASNFTSVSRSPLQDLENLEFSLLNSVYDGFDKSKNSFGSIIKKFGSYMFDTEEVMQRLVDLGDYQPAASANYSNSRFASYLKTSANLIKNTSVELLYMDYPGGFDTHQNQNLTRNFSDIAASLKSFYKDLGEKMNDVTVIVGTEFGRTVIENSNKGTDHGSAGTWLAMGKNLQGGMHYDFRPSFARSDLFGRNALPIQTNYGDVVIEALDKHMGYKNLDKVFPGFNYQGVGVFNS